MTTHDAALTDEQIAEFRKRCPLGCASLHANVPAAFADLVADARSEAEWYSGTESYKDQATARILRQAAAALQSQAENSARLADANEALVFACGLAVKRAETDEARIAELERMDSEAAEYVESVICMRTHFTGEPPYVGWKGLGLALREALDERDALQSQDDKVAELARLTEEWMRRAVAAEARVQELQRELAEYRLPKKPEMWDMHGEFSPGSIQRKIDEQQS